MDYLTALIAAEAALRPAVKAAGREDRKEADELRRMFWRLGELIEASASTPTPNEEAA